VHPALALLGPPWSVRACKNTEEGGREGGREGGSEEWKREGGRETEKKKGTFGFRLGAFDFLAFGLLLCSDCSRASLRPGSVLWCVAGGSWSGLFWF
jgi:hypothetical protein